MKRVVVTGSECTGKTTLAGDLARHYSAPWVPEFVRQLVARKGGPADAGDIDEIARGQIALEERLARDAGRLLVQDTDLLSTVVYSEHYYGRCPRWIREELERRAADLYLVADIDVPWVADGDQRDRGHRRQEIQDLFRDALAYRGLPFVEIRGARDVRVRQATRRVDQLLATRQVKD